MGPGIEIDPRNPDRVFLTSGNGLWVCDNVWDEKDIQFYIEPNGIEEVVPIDLISIKGGYLYSTILDFDGFIHKKIDEPAEIYIPNIGATGVIAACKENTNIMMRISTSQNVAYYSENAGRTWKKMKSAGGFGGGRGAITLIGDEKYRFFHTSSNEIKYSYDYGNTWNNSTGTLGEQFSVFVEEADPMIIYSYSYIRKSDSNPKAQNILGISGDGGKTFTNKVVCDYDGSDFSNRIAYLSEGRIVIAAGNKGI